MRSCPLEIEKDETKETWSELPTLLLWMVREKLQYVDNLQLAAVCKHWHRASMSCSLKELQTAHDRLPWQLITRRRCLSEGVVVNVLNGKKYTIEHPDIHGTIPLVSKEGWLLLAYPVIPPLILASPFPSRSIFLFNPFTKQKIVLPEARLPRRAAIAILNGIPNCIAVAFMARRGVGTPCYLTLQIMHPNDKEWKTYDYIPGEGFRLVLQMFFIDNFVYFADGLGHILRFNRTDSSWAEALEEEDKSLLDVEQHILERDGEVIKIIPKLDNSYQITHFVFRKLNENKTAWIQLNDYEMEGKSWFLDIDYRSRTFSFVANGTSKSKIYWLDTIQVEGQPDVRQMEVYDLERLSGAVQKVSTISLHDNHFWVDLG